MAEPWTELRSARENAGISQQELGVKAGMSYTQISKLERGERDALNITVGNLWALAEALDMDPVDLIGDRRKGKRSNTIK